MRLSPAHRFRFVLSTAALLAVAWVAYAELSHRGDALDRRIQARRARVAAPAPAVIQEGCDGIRQSIACGETVTTTIRPTDCATDSGVLFDEIFFSGQNGQTVTITMTSNDFDPYLVLFDPDIEDVAEDDNSGPGNNGAQIVHRLNRTSNDWSVTPTPLEPDVTGTYTLSLACTGTSNDGFVSHPNVPGFQFKVTIRGATAIAGRLEPTCLPETVCVSGAIPGRPEVLLRVVGPRPNGLLWPTIVKFTTAEVEVVVRQVRTGQTKTYLLEGAAPGFDELTGLFDRNGFVP
jgi:hypothetical protein